MQEYPFKATIIPKSKLLKEKDLRNKYCWFLRELKPKLLPGQAIQVFVASKAEKAGVTSAWKRINKGLEPHFYTVKKSDDSYLIHLWLGKLQGE